MVLLVEVLALSCAVRLFDLQIVKGSDYEVEETKDCTAPILFAPRGKILDCNDKPLVKNRMGYSIQVQKMDIPNDELNRILYDAAALCGVLRKPYREHLSDCYKRDNR